MPFFWFHGVGGEDEMGAHAICIYTISVRQPSTDSLNQDKQGVLTVYMCQIVSLLYQLIRYRIVQGRSRGCCR